MALPGIFLRLCSAEILYGLEDADSPSDQAIFLNWKSPRREHREDFPPPNKQFINPFFFIQWGKNPNPYKENPLASIRDSPIGLLPQPDPDIRRQCGIDRLKTDTEYMTFVGTIVVTKQVSYY